MEFIRKYAYIILGIVCVLALGGLYMVGRTRPAGVMEAGPPLVPPAEVQAAEAPPDTQPEIAEAPPTPEPEPTMIMVHIVGAVHSPGVFEVPYGSRVNDVLQLAGGYTEDADLALINLAAFVQDAMQIRIPAIGEEPEIIEGGSPGQQNQQNQSATTADGRININLANLTELQTLPGIGPVRAQSIIDLREASGGFNSIDELLNVSGIGQAVFENIRDRVAVD